MINLAEYTTITEQQFSSMQFDSGVVLSSFDPTNPTDITGDKILFATTGDISITSGKEIVDLGEDVNNLHGRLKELQYLSNRTNTVSFTALNLDAATLAYALGAATTSRVTGSNVAQQVELKNFLELSDFKDVWWVGMLIGGGVVAVNLKNALSTDDVSLSTSKDGKGNLSVTLTAFGTIRDLTLVPITYYYIPEMSVSIDNQNITLAPNGTQLLTATISKPATILSVTSTWRSMNTNVATVAVDAQDDTKATVTAVAAGKSAVVVTTTDGHGVTVTSTCYITVTSGV